jgi:hypothetical protein
MIATHLAACPWAVCALLCYLAASLRLLMYRRDGARHRRHVSWIAWAMLVTFGASVVELALADHPAGVIDAARALLFVFIVFGARGNVARILRSNNP